MQNILVVDDDNKIVEGLALILKENFGDSLNVFVANDGIQALKVMKEVPISLLISDIKMPVMSGMELLNFIKINGLEILVIMLSGYDDYSLIRKALRNDAYDYLLKPVNIKSFISVVEQAVPLLPSYKPMHKFEFPDIISNEDMMISSFFDVCCTQPLPQKEANKILWQALEDLIKAQYDSAIGKINIYFNSISQQYFDEMTIRHILTKFMYTLMEREPTYIPIIASSKLTEYDIMTTIKNLPTLSQVHKSFCDINMHYSEIISARQKDAESRTIDRAKEYIQQHLQDSIHLCDVAGCFYLHPNYFSTIFKTHTGITFRDYLRNARINKAKELMTSGNQKLSVIATMVGYQDTSHFNRAFKEVTGCSPSQFRKRK